MFVTFSQPPRPKNLPYVVHWSRIQSLRIIKQGILLVRTETLIRKYLISLLTSKLITGHVVIWLQNQRTNLQMLCATIYPINRWRMNSPAFTCTYGDRRYLPPPSLSPLYRPA